MDALIGAIPNTTDPTKRNAMLWALGRAPGAEANVARDFALTRQVKVGEVLVIFYARCYHWQLSRLEETIEEILNSQEVTQ